MVNPFAQQGNLPNALPLIFIRQREYIKQKKIDENIRVHWTGMHGR